MSTDKLKSWLVCALWFVPTVYALNFCYAVWKGGSGGTFGDTFGASNAIFSGTALLMLVYAIMLQREELATVKLERDDTKKMLSAQEKLIDDQKKALDQQIFDQRFFALINSTSKEIGSLDRIVGHQPTTAKEPISLLKKANSEAGSALVSGEGLNSDGELVGNPSFLDLMPLAKLVGLAVQVVFSGSPQDPNFYYSAIRALLDDKVMLILATIAICRGRANDDIALAFRELELLNHTSPYHAKHLTAAIERYELNHLLD